MNNNLLKLRLFYVRKILILSTLSFLLIFYLGYTSGFPNSANHLLIISIDGLRPDALLEADTPNIDSLSENGSYTPKAQTILPSSTLPAHVSMLTGVTPERHGIEWNYWNPSKGYVKVKTIFEIAHQHGLITAMFIGKEKLKHLAKPGTVDFLDYPGQDLETIAEAAWKYIVLEKPNLVFIHLPDPDGLGHKYGWLSDEQIKGIERADRAIGKILSVLYIMGIDDSTAIIVTSDHGGHGTTHGTDDPLDLTIPWIINGPQIKSNYLIQRVVNVYDTAPTGLFTLEISAPENWEGRVISEAFGLT